MLVLSLVSLSVSAAPPVNDFWSDGTVIQGTSGTVIGTVVEATAQSCELDHQFPDEAGTTAKNSVWYKFIVPANASYTFRITEATNLDPTLSAYRFAPGICNGNVVPTPIRIIENHRYNYNLGLDGKSRISFRAVAGEAIYIAVDSFSNLEGPFSLSWEKTRYRYSTQLD